METKIPDWISREDSKVDPIADLVRLFGRWSENYISDQKLYISSARGWRDRDSILTKLYAIEALEERPWMIYGRDAASPDKRFVTIGDDATNIDHEWREEFYDKRIYQFINGSSIHVLGSAPAPIKIELSFSELVGEE